MKQYRALGVLGLVAALWIVLPAPVSATLGSKFEEVTMIYVGGEICVEVDKQRATIYRDRRPKRVKWVVKQDGNYWEIRYQASGATDPDKGEGMGDFFSSSGNLDIGCSEHATRTELPAMLAPANASWPYMIKVYECNGGVKGRPLCELDPIIDWGDG